MEPSIVSQPVKPLKPLSFVDLLNKTGNILKDNFWHLYAILLISNFSSELFSLFVDQLRVSGIGIEASRSLLLTNVLVSASDLFIALFLNAWASLAVVYALVRNTGVLDSYKLSVKRIIPFAVLGFFAFISFWGGLTLLLIPGLAITLRYFLAQFVFVDTEEGIRRSLERSYAYVSKFAGNTLIKLLFATPLLIVVTGLIITPISGLLANLGVPLISSLGSALTNPIPTMVILSFYYCIYTDLKGLSEPIEPPKVKFFWGWFIVGVISITALIVIGILFVVKGAGTISEYNSSQRLPDLQNEVVVPNESISPKYSNF